jgi:GNAT superfamily N-acetyltransferase
VTSIRDAGPEDARRIAELIQGGSLAPELEDPSDPARYADALAEIAATPGQAALVAEVDGEVVGTCLLVIFRHLSHRGGRCAEVESLHVDEASRGRRIGEALVVEAIRRAKEAGCYRIQLTSHQTRTDAHRFYRRLGFVPSHAGFKLDLT